MNEKIIALDLGQNLGVATWSRFLLKSFSVNLKAKTDYERYQTFIGVLSFYIYADYFFVIEKPHAGSFFSAVKCLFGYIGIIQSKVKDKNLVFYSPKTIKKYWTGNGNAKKKDMVDKCRLLNYDLNSKDEADAVAMMCYHLKKTINYDPLEIVVR